MMAKNMQNESCKKKNSKQRSKSNLQYNDYKSNEKLNNRSSENNLKYDNQTNQNNLKKATSTISNYVDTNNNKINSTSTIKKNENNSRRSNGYMETKIRNNFTIRGYRRKQENRRKRNSMGNNLELHIPSNHSNRIETKNIRYNSKSPPWTTSSNYDQYLEAGTYEGEGLIMKDGDSREKMFSDDDAYSVISDISDFCQREQFNVECYNYYLNFGDPYVMNNGEISSSENNWYYDRQPSYGRVFYYRSQFNDVCYESAMRYNYPNHQEFKYRNYEPYPICNARGVCMNNYMTNGYINGYIDPGLIPNEYYPYQISHAQEFIQDRYFKPVIYEEPDDIYNPNNYSQENDTLNVINLNSSLFVYNSNVHINTVHNEIYGVNTITNDNNELMNDEDGSTINNGTLLVDPSVTTEKEVYGDKDFPSSEYENCN